MIKPQKFRNNKQPCDNQDPQKDLRNNPRCATPFMDTIQANWKQEESPYNNPRYDIPSCQREKIIPQSLGKAIRCATPTMEMIYKLEVELE